MASSPPIPSPPPSPLLALPGAVPADPPDEGIAAHYGDPFREQRRLVAGTGFVDLSNRGVVRVGGPDRLTWLHSLTSQHLSGLRPGQATEALVLSPHGHVEHALYLVDDGEATWMHVEPGTVGALVAFLDSMRFMLRVQVEDLTAERAMVWTPPGARPPGGLARVTGHGQESFWYREELGDWARSRPDPAGLWAYEALRIEAHRPRLGFETDHRTIPHEVGWLSTAVHLDKGCYRGQETVARVHNLGRPPRRLVFLHLDGSAETLPAHGTPVRHEDRQVGFVTSAARHHELGPIGMALVKRNTPDGVTVFAGDVPAMVEPVAAAVPAEPAAAGRRLRRPGGF